MCALLVVRLRILDVEVAERVRALAVGNDAEVLAAPDLVQVLLDEVLERPLRERHLRLDGHRSRRPRDLNSVELATLAVDLDPLLEVVLLLSSPVSRSHRSHTHPTNPYPKQSRAQPEQHQEAGRQRESTPHNHRRTLTHHRQTHTHTHSLSQASTLTHSQPSTHILSKQRTRATVSMIPSETGAEQSMVKRTFWDWRGGGEGCE